MSNLLVVVGCLLLGLALARARWLPADAPVTLNVWVLYVALPALVVARLSGVAPSPAALVPAAMAWIQVALVAAIVAGIGRWLRWDRKLRATVMLAAGFGNTAFVGLPLIRALLGEPAMPEAILADQLGTFLALATVGLAIADWGAGQRVGVGSMFRRAARFPAVWGLVVAFTLPVPTILREALGMVGDTLTPIALFSIGLQLRLRGGGPALPVVIGLVLKLLVAPAAVLAVYLAAGVRGQTLEVAILQCAMAPMTTAAILAAERELAPDVAHRLVGFGVPLCLVTVPAWAAALGWLQTGRS